MLRTILIAGLIISIFGCDSREASTFKTETDSTGKFFIPTYQVQKFEGTYSGSFDDGFITIVLNYVKGKNVSGYNLHKGLRRSINGMLSESASGFSFELKEPGDNPYDGIFSFTIDTVNFKLSGWWKPFDSSKLTSKKLLLARQKAMATDYSDQLGSWVPVTADYSTDTMLQFDPRGTCEYVFYEKPGDSTSQLISVKGNYVQHADTILIEWQKNDHTPAQKMQLVKELKKIKQEDYDYEQAFLKGHGWRLTQFMGG